MKVTYDPEVDILRILFNNVSIQESNEESPGVILDYDREGNIVGLEILKASQRIKKTQSVEFSVALKKTQSTLEKPVIETQALTLSQRQAFLKLPLEERRRILAEQAEAMVAHYEQNPEGRELQGGDIFKY